MSEEAAMQVNRRKRVAAGRRAAASARRSSISMWQMWGELPLDDDDGIGADRPPAEPSMALMERIRQAHGQRLATGEQPRRIHQDPAEAPQDEMLQFVLALDDRSTANAYLAPVDPAAGPIEQAPRPLGAEPLVTVLPRRVSAGSSPAMAPVPAASVPVVTVPVVTETRHTCPRCGGRELRVDELDLDAASCTRTCTGCGDTFTTPI